MLAHCSLHSWVEQRLLVGYTRTRPSVGTHACSTRSGRHIPSSSSSSSSSTPKPSCCSHRSSRPHHSTQWRAVPSGGWQRELQARQASAACVVAAVPPAAAAAGAAAAPRAAVAVAAGASSSAAAGTGGGSMQGSVDPLYLAAAAYLAELGFTNKTEIARVLDIAMNPASLFVTASANANARPLSVEGDIRPVVEFLRDRGLSGGDLVKVISGHPPVLSYSVEGRLAPFWEYLGSIGVDDVGTAVRGRPSLLGLDVDASLRKIVDYLTYVGTDSEKIVEYICKSI